WPGDPPLASRQALDLLDMADRLVVDGSHWSGNGIDRLHALARLVDDHEGARGSLTVSDFAMLRPSRWREAIASSFDRPELQPFLRCITDITVTYAVHAGTRRGEANVIKPLYHVAWLASRLGMSVVQRLEHLTADGGGSPATAAAPDEALEPPRVGALRAGRRRVTVTLRPVESPAPRGTTLTVELAARRRSTPVSIIVSAEADAVMVRARLDGRPLPERRFMAPRRTEVDLLVEAVESVGRDSIAVAALLMAADLIGQS
ncbi:MAG: glucose-6-phosphate dehydrogenase assembly protein OpcA, partial [Chloroflexi bacterium]|nr:glucose-6-phosphate dehydrogenase assembly protein OpcA [Chloroflexota bacterium]